MFLYLMAYYFVNIYSHPFYHYFFLKPFQLFPANLFQYDLGPNTLINSILFFSVPFKMLGILATLNHLKYHHLQANIKE